MAKRIFELAKELGVKSTAVVTKCKAEGVDIKNHMSTLSAGLEATIREWFSIQENATTVETTAKVDLEKVRTKPKRKPKKTKAKDTESQKAQEEKDKAAAEKSESGEEESLPPGVASEPAQEKEPAAVARRKSPKEILAEEQEVLARPDAEQAASEMPAEKKEPDTFTSPEQAAAAKPGESAPEADSKEKPSPVIQTLKPAKKLPPRPPVPFVPAPAKLQGPRVIRTVSMDEPAPVKRGPRKNTVLSDDDLVNLDVPVSGKSGGVRRRKGKPVIVSDEEEQAKNKKSKVRQNRSGRRYEAAVSGGHEWGDRDLLERQQRLAKASGSQLHRRERLLARGDTVSSSGRTQAPPPHRIEEAKVREPITVKELSSVIGVRSNEILAKLMSLGVMVTINQVLDADSATMVSLEFGIELKVEKQVSMWNQMEMEFDQAIPEDQLKPRPPVVAFLGHVDHGKTSLLDRIRKASVVSGEAGGITQHIGAYLYEDGQRRITFLDTPGHKAFTEMRARGANMTDILVLVIAADDGVMPQTEEAINHAKAAGVPIVVALNKIDLPNADENRVFGQLSERELVPTEWGGNTEVVRTSAVTGEGIEDLLEHLEYVAELHHLTASVEGRAMGWVVESEMTPQQGVIARLLVKQGTLNSGDIVVSGSSYGRIRSLKDSFGRTIEQAGPSTPVIITGLDEIPTSGFRFFVPENISQAAQIAQEQKEQQREKALAQRRLITLENLFSEIKAGEINELNVIVKADVQGSVDVLKNTIIEMNTPEVAVRILHAAVGGISESDVLLAQASNAIIIGFQVIADEHAKSLADREGVEIRFYRVIYQISDDIRKALEGMLKPRIEEKPLGRIEVRQVFRISRLGVIAGCMVTEGIVKRSSRLRVVRDNIVIRDENPIASLRRAKDDASEVRAGFECGIRLEGYDDIKVGDVLESFELVEVSRTLESVSQENG